MVFVEYLVQVFVFLLKYIIKNMPISHVLFN